MSDELREECGIFAVAGHPRALEMTYYGLYALQHRGQESTGIAWVQDGKIRSIKGMGLVSDVLTRENIANLSGMSALGHVRYSTSGESRIENAQPISVKMWRGPFALAHNGNLVNAGELRTNLEHQGSIFQSTSDSEVIPHLLARSPNGDFLDAFVSALSEIRGAYSLAAITNEGIVAAKDPNGFRPLCIGTLDGAFVVSSETCGLDAVGAEFVREIEPGEIIQLMVPENGEGKVTQRRILGTKAETTSLCVFEFIYLARPDSDIYGLNVHSVRKALGRALAKKAPVEADLVTGVPDSSLSAASGYAEQAGIPYEMGLVKNRYVGRTFIAPEQSMREFAVKIKLNPLKSLIRGKRVVLVDDSIVRGTTSRYIVGLLRSAGAKEVHVRISSPPYRFPCYYGIDTSSRGELAATGMSVDEIRTSIDADSLVYLDVEDLSRVMGEKVTGFCHSCFTGNYPVDVSLCAGKGGCGS